MLSGDNMELPKQFNEQNAKNIFIYHYIEELIASFSKYMDENLDGTGISKAEFPFLVRIRFSEKTTQKELVELFKVSEGYTAKLLRKFEDNGYITRKEDPSNRRVKIVELTSKGIEKTDELSEIISNWESQISSNTTQKEISQLKEVLFKLLI